MSLLRRENRFHFGGHFACSFNIFACIFLFENQIFAGLVSGKAGVVGGVRWPRGSKVDQSGIEVEPKSNER